jgi:hypothetical protein
VGASILSNMIKVYGYNWEAVGAYNAGLKKEIIRSGWFMPIRSGVNIRK